MRSRSGSFRVAEQVLAAASGEGMRLLIATEHRHRSYREVLVYVLAALRPGLDVEPAAPEEFEERLESFAPHVVLCGLEDCPRREGPLAWVDLAYGSPPVQRPGRAWVAGRNHELPEPTLEDLLWVVEEAEAALASGSAAPGAAARSGARLGQRTGQA
jgi:hypothetical protein